MKIGFFDSGIGGITVLHEALKELPHEDYIYYADTENVPYGVKPKYKVREFIYDAVEFIVQRDVKAIVVACNTATSIAIQGLRDKYNIPVIGMEPAVKPAVENESSRHKRVLVTATPLTLKEEKLKNLIARVDNEHIVDLLPLPGLVEFAERLEFSEHSVRPYLKERLSEFDLEDYGTVVLGCTHFPFFKDIFKGLLPKDIDIIDGSTGTVRHLKTVLKEKNLTGSGAGLVEFFNSGHRIDNAEKLEEYRYLFERLSGMVR